MTTTLNGLGPDASRTQLRRAVNAAIQHQNILNGIDEEGKHNHDVDPATGESVSKPNGASSLAGAAQQVVKTGGVHDIGTQKTAKLGNTQRGDHDGFKRNQPPAAAALHGTPLRNTET